MKKIYLIILMILFSVFQAQNLNIPDPNFKSFLLAANPTNPNNVIAFNSTGQAIVIDTNADGEIQVTEANAVYKLIVNYTPISSLAGINGFTNLSIISIYGLDIPGLDFSNMPNLFSIELEGLDDLTSFTINNCPSLQKLKFHDTSLPSALTLVSASIKEIDIKFCNDLHTLNILGCSALEDLKVANTYISSLNLSNLPTLKNLVVDSNGLLTNINFQNLSGLLTAKFNGGGPMTSLNLGNSTALTKLTVSMLMGLQNLNISGCTALEDLTVSDTPLTSINLSNNNQLKYVDLSDNNLNTLDVSNLSALVNLYCDENNLTSLDTSHNPLMYNISCKYNNITQLFFKNGNPTIFFNVYFENNPGLQYICCDPEDITYFTDRLSFYGYGNSNVVVNTYCSFTPGGAVYTIQGNTKYDSNNNGCDSNDLNKAFQKFNLVSGTTPAGYLLSNNSGNYSIPVQAGSHTITPVLENPAYFTVSPTSLTANFPTQTSPLNQSFCISANGTHNDLEAVIIPITAAAPGFAAKYKIIYKNKGTTTQSGALAFNYNDNLMNFTTSTVTPSSQSTGVLNWNFTNLLPFETKEITVTFTLNTPTQTPPLNGNDVLHYTAQITGAADETPLDNTFMLNQTVVNSFDPNDKTCLEGASITQAQVGDYVHYMIRFENTGTANAQNIVVKDDIDASKFDLSSLISLNGSHNFITRINGNTVEFIFENIQLPFNDATNDGYISFKIKTKSTLNLGDSFSNKANIYFDYNAPIITNNYTTTVQNILGTTEINHDKTQFSIYPNPVKDVLFIKSKEKVVKAEIYDTSGRILNSASTTDNSINVSELAKGNYIIKLFTKDKSVTQKFIKN